MAISAWLDKGRRLSGFDRNEQNIIHLSKKRSKFFAVYFTLTTFAFVTTYLPYNPTPDVKCITLLPIPQDLDTYRYK
jgi:hypothetical protein